MNLEQGLKEVQQSCTQHAIDGRLGLILDSTARDTARIESEAIRLDILVMIPTWCLLIQH